MLQLSPLRAASRVENMRTFTNRARFLIDKAAFNLKIDIVHFHVGGNLNFRVSMLMLICGLYRIAKPSLHFIPADTSGAIHFAKRLSLRGFAFRSLDFVIAVNSQCSKCSAIRVREIK
jgi:hypothetical protein